LLIWRELARCAFANVAAWSETPQDGHGSRQNRNSLLTHAPHLQPSQRRHGQKREQMVSGGFDQFHLAIALAMQNLHITFVISKDKNIAIAKLRLFHRLFQGHRPQRD
jgi:hypothetical protein